MKVIYFTVSVMLFAGCTFISEPDPVIVENNIPLLKQITMGQEFTLGIGDTASVIGTDIELRLVDIPEDSRCPALADCIWEGRVVISLEVAGLAESSTDFNLLMPGLSYEPTSLDTLDYRFILVKVDPYPQYSPEILDSDYEVTLVVTALFIVN